MTDKWLFLHLSAEHADAGPGGWCAELEMIRSLRETTVGTQWFFDRPDGGFTLWIHTGIRNRREIVRRFQAAAAAGGWRVVQRRGYPPTRQFADPRSRWYAEELATVSSELALSLCRAGEAVRTEPATAVLHLWSLLGAVTGSARTAFLFSCWEYWTRRMRPDRRVELAVLADRLAAGTLARAAELCADDRFGGAWQRQVLVAEQLSAAEVSAWTTPVNYLMFEHAKTSAARLSLPPDTLALAAAVLRRALLDGAVGARPEVRRPDSAPAVPAPH